MDKKFTRPKGTSLLCFTVLLVLLQFTASAQLGVFPFTGNGACPNQNPSVLSQPSNALFSDFTLVTSGGAGTATCKNIDNVFAAKDLNKNGGLDMTEYFSFSVTPSNGYVLNLTSLSFSHYAEELASGNYWHLRSSIDNYAADIDLGLITISTQTPVINLPATTFSNLGSVTFHIYIEKIKDHKYWAIDDVTLNGAAVIPPPVPGNPTSNSPQCSSPGVTLTAAGSAPAGVTWYWQTGATGTSIANSGSTYNVNTSGTYYIRAKDDVTNAWSNGAGNATVVVTPDVTSPTFTLGATSSRCQGANSTTFTAAAANNTGIVYTLDAVSLAGNNTIDPSTGAVTFDAAWTGVSTITATASGCSGPKSSTHTVTTNTTIGAPVFTGGSSSFRCVGAGTQSYPATASNATITYSIDAASQLGGNSINPANGTVNWNLLWVGITTITATANGCGGPLTATHTVTINGAVTTPTFGTATSIRCQGAGQITYTATSSNASSITYSIDGTSSSNGNSINPATGEVTYAAAWSGTTVITASAAGCNGPKTATHTVTVTPTVGTPVFTAASTRCQGAATISYAATASNSTSRSYTLDAASLAGGNSIVGTTGAVTFSPTWSGTSTITCTAAGCNGPSTSTFTVTTTPSVTGLSFTSGSTSTRCQGAGNVLYDAAATNTTGITYSLNGAAITGGNSIDVNTGTVTYSAGWTGATVITATAAGCTPLTATHTVTITPTVGNVTFTGGSTSTRCQGANSVTYTANATNNTGITYALDATSLAGNNTINPATGAVSYDAAWTGVSTITATATGCNGPKTATRTETTTITIGAPSFTGGAASTRCQGAGSVPYPATATNAVLSYALDGTSLSNGNTINSANGTVTYAAAWSGTSVITVTATGCGGPLTTTHTVTITPTVGTPSFGVAGTSSIRCQGAGVVSYPATATTNTGITYSIDAASTTGGNSINPATGDVTYVASWSGTTVITATATGCNGPKSSTHTVTVTPTVGTPIFTGPPASVRCQGAATVSYAATATNSTSRTYTLDPATSAGGNSINASGSVTWSATWSGTTTITVTAAGCNGPSTATFTVTTTPTVGTPVFNAGNSSTRCQGAGTATYDATATNATTITYSLNTASVTGGNSINASGVVTWSATWSGTTTITATATGCNGPKTSTHTVTITPTVGTPVFTSGATSARCQGAQTITYGASASTTTGITYSLDAASITGGNSIDANTGAVTYVPAWTGTTIITASAAGCNGPKTATHTVTNNTTVGATTFTGGSTSTRCQGAGTVSYPASAPNSTSIIYSIDGITGSNGNTINSITGAVAYSATWSGTTIITATSNGCNGPTTATHTVTVTPTVGTPVFTGGATSTRCQGANSVTYIATATNSTSITYSLDATSIAGGNSIVAATGVVTYAANWTGTSTITASAAGCNGPKTATRTETTTPTVGTPVFTNGMQSVRTQGAGTTLYSATATNSTIITYSLDPASVAGGNSINNLSGVVTWNNSWFGTSQITASASGCNGPSSSTHIVNINPTTVQSPLYLSTGLTLDRVDPVATNIATTLQTVDLSAAATTNVTFTLNPALCSNLTIKAQTIAVAVYCSVTSGTMPSNPAITANLSYNGTTIINLINPVYNSISKLLTWSAVLGADVIVSAGQTIDLKITTAQPSLVFKIDYHSATKPSRVSLFPISTYIDFVSFDVYNAPYPGGQKRISGYNNVTYYVRAVVTTPFGYKDITGMDIKISPPGVQVPVTCVDSSTCTRTYEYPWTPTGGNGAYYLVGIAREGYENIIKNSELTTFSICQVCAPVAVTDSITGPGGTPIIINVLANDYDPNNDIKLSSLNISGQPNNGQAYISNNKVVYLPNGSYAGKDTLMYQICDNSGLCATGSVFITINPFLVDPCSEATKTHVYYMPFPENEARVALDSSSSVALASNNIRTIISLKIPYPGMVIVWDEWEDGYEANSLNPLQPTTKVWGDGNPYNGIAPGYPNDIIPPGANIVLDNTIPTNPRVSSNIYYDGRDKITSSGQITLTQVCGEPSIIGLQCMKTNVSSTIDYGKSFTIPVGENFNSRDFYYTSLFIRASENNTYIQIDKDNNGTLETLDTLQEGQVLMVNGDVLSGATVTSNNDIGVDLHFGGNDNYSSRDVPIFPATWYSNTYYSPVPTTGRTTQTIKDSSVVLLYNSLNRPININWSSGVPASGTINLPAKTVVRFPLVLSQTAAYKFVNPTGESFTAIETVDSYTPGGGGNVGSDFDWSFNLIAENRLTDFATIAWAPGSTDGTRNDNPVWVTPTANTTIYVKYDGNVSGTVGSLSPCGLRYDVSYTLNNMNFKRLLDPNDNDQSGLAVYTCNGAKLAAVYGEDPSTATPANPSWDVGSTIQPFCKQKLIFANDDYARTLLNQPVTIPILLNDFGYLAIIDPASVTNTALLQPKHGTIFINSNGTIVFTPAQGYLGKDTFEYNVCSTPSNVVCDVATVYIDISTCPAPSNSNLITGRVYNDQNEDALYNDNAGGVAGGKVILYIDGNCNNIPEANEAKDSVIVDASGAYQFTSLPEKTIIDDFDGPGGTRTCANGSDGNSAWAGNWTDLGDPSSGFCNTSQTVANTDCEITKNGSFSYALRLKHASVSATRIANLSGASYAFLSFDYQRKSNSLGPNEDVIVQASTNGTSFATIFTIQGDSTADAGYVSIYNQDISAYTTSSTTYIRFLTNPNVDDNDTVYIDNVKIQFLKYPICYITKFDPASVPQYYHTTTILQRSFTASSSQTCHSYYDFGLARNKISVSGTLYRDPNGVTDNLINGSICGTVSGATVYAYLLDTTTGKVMQRALVSATSGTYNFPSVDVASPFKVMLSAVSVNVGDDAPPDEGWNLLTGNWASVGDSYGVNNAAGTGIKAGPASCLVPLNTGTVNVTNVNFGIEMLPESDDRLVSHSINTPNTKYDITGGLTGSDPEDGILGSGKTYKITFLPVNAKLYYNNILVTLNQVITGFNPTLFKIDPDDDVMQSTFKFASRDAAGLYDPTPATITVRWLSVVPINSLVFSGMLTRDKKTDLDWTTGSEVNTSRFDVERSITGQTFSKIGSVAAHGSPNAPAHYEFTDESPVAGSNYYRLKIFDNDGSHIYSNIVTVRLNANNDLNASVRPNPFKSNIEVSFTLAHDSKVTLIMYDQNGKTVFVKEVKGLKGVNKLPVMDLDKLAAGSYILRIITDDVKTDQKILKF